MENFCLNPLIEFYAISAHRRCDDERAQETGRSGDFDLHSRRKT